MSRGILKLIIFLSALVIFGGVGYYVTQSGRIFFKALSLEQKGRESIALIAHQAVLNKYPYSPFSTASRAILYDDVEELHRMNRLRQSLGADESDFAEIGNPIFVDFFVFSGLAFIVLLGVVGIFQRIVRWRGMKGGAIVRRMIFALSLAAGYWVFTRIYFNDPRFSDWRSAVEGVDAGLLSEEVFFMATLIFAGLVLLWAFIASCKFLGSFSKLLTASAIPPKNNV